MKNLKIALQKAKESSIEMFSSLNEKELSMITGGEMAAFASCGRTGSSSGCDAVAVCNCPPPPTEPIKPKQ